MGWCAACDVRRVVCGEWVCGGEAEEKGSAKGERAKGKGDRVKKRGEGEGAGE
jgi:hypothetical protein